MFFFHKILEDIERFILFFFIIEAIFSGNISMVSVKMSSRASRTLYVGNLPGDIREREVEDLFYKVIQLLLLFGFNCMWHGIYFQIMPFVFSYYGLLYSLVHSLLSSCIWVRESFCSFSSSLFFLLVLPLVNFIVLLWSECR